MLDYTTLLDKIIPKPDAEDVLRLRVGTVSVVNANGTLDVTMSDGTVVPGVPRLTGAIFAVGAIVQMLSYRGSLMVIGAVSMGSARVEAFLTANTTFTNTSFAVPSGVELHGIAFVAPPSGAVEILVEGWLAISHSAIGVRSYMTAQVREGAVLNTGTIFDAANDDQSAIVQNSAVSILDYRYVSIVYGLSGLTPGASYNACTAVKISSATTGAYNDRRIIVRPI